MDGRYVSHDEQLKTIDMMTVVTPPNANPNSEFADIGRLEAPACSSEMISIGKTNNKRRDFYIVQVLLVKVTTLF